MSFGKIYQKVSDAEGLDKYHESTRLALFVTGNQHAQSWIDPVNPKTPEKSAVDFHQLAGYVQHILKRMNVDQVSTEVITLKAFDYGLTYIYKNKPVAHLGMLTRKLCKALNVSQSVLYADLDWDFLLKKYKSQVKIEEISRFPEVRRDLSLVLDKKVSFEDIKKLAFAKEKKLLKDVNVFDVYEGTNIDANKKAYAISLILEDKDKTMTVKDIDQKP